MRAIRLSMIAKGSTAWFLPTRRNVNAVTPGKNVKHARVASVQLHITSEERHFGADNLEGNAVAASCTSHMQ